MDTDIEEWNISFENSTDADSLHYRILFRPFRYLSV